MKALSIRQPFIDEICTGDKSEEYRSRNTSYRGDLLLCSSASKAELLPVGWPFFVFGQALCIAELYNVEKLPDGGFAWQLRNVRNVKPFPVKGRPGLFDVETEPEVLDVDDIQQYWVDEGLVRSLDEF